MYLADTNVASELRKLAIGKADPRVVSWFQQHPLNAFYLSAVTVFELRYGVLNLHRKDRTQAANLALWLERLLSEDFSGRILPFTAEGALRCAELHIPNPRSDRDAMIAATAWIHGLTIVTRNVSDFTGTGVSIINPWL